MGYGLTPRQKKLFDFIKSYMKKEPVAPTYRDMKKATGIHLSQLHKEVAALEERGWITRLKGKNRSIRISP